MDSDELRRLVAEVQHRRMEPDAVEVKAAHGGTPKVYDSLSAFANRPGGGIILLGLDEKQGFDIVGVGNPQRVQEDIANWVRDEMEPPVDIEFTVDEIDGAVVMAIEVREAAQEQKPCYYKPKGLRGNGGAYLRAGGTDRAMTDYEIFGYISARGQPKHDEDPVIEATLGDLDEKLLDDYLNKLRAGRPNVRYLDGQREEVLTRLHICCQHDGSLHPTLAGLLMFGKYPQEFFPQLMITFVQFYGTVKGEPTPRGERFLDNQRFEGPIPAMLRDAETHILGTMRKAALIDGLLRRDIPEYPLAALREALANAVAHRDHSAYVRGSYIQARMFADRLEVQSPGGLFGKVNVDNLEDEHSTRNSRLMRMMEDLHLVENRGTGISTMLQALREANLEPPRFDDRRTSFWVTFRNHTLLNPEAIAWLNQYAKRPLNDRQRLALVYLRQQEQISNSDYRRLNHVDSMQAGQELRTLVQEGLIEQHGVSRWTYYTLKELERPVEHTQQPSEEERILAFARQNGSISNAECRDLLDVDLQRASYLLKKMTREGRLQQEGERRWARYRLP